MSIWNRLLNALLIVYYSTLASASFMHPPVQLLSITCTQSNNYLETPLIIYYFIRFGLKQCLRVLDNNYIAICTWKMVQGIQNIAWGTKFYKK